MKRDELTMADVLRDPMIRLMLRADRVPLSDFANLLETAAAERRRRRDAQAVIYVSHASGMSRHKPALARAMKAPSV